MALQGGAPSLAFCATEQGKKAVIVFALAPGKVSIALKAAHFALKTADKTRTVIVSCKNVNFLDTPFSQKNTGGSPRISVNSCYGIESYLKGMNWGCR